MAFVLGVAAPYTSGAPDVVFITRRISFAPAEQPVLNGLFFVANVLVFELAVALGLVVTAVLWRTRLLFPVVAGGMALSGCVGAGLAVFGGRIGFSPDQRGGMVIVALTLGGLGGLMCFAAVRDLVRGRKKGAQRTR